MKLAPSQTNPSLKKSISSPFRFKKHRNPAWAQSKGFGPKLQGAGELIVVCVVVINAGSWVMNAVLRIRPRAVLYPFNTTLIP